MPTPDFAATASVVICELKLSFDLVLILEAVDRAAVADEVWIAARVAAKGKGREADKRSRDLCRRLGIGMLGTSDAGDVGIIVASSLRQSGAQFMPNLTFT